MEADSTSITQRSNISASLWSNGASQVGCLIHSLTRKIENTSFMKERRKDNIALREELGNTSMFEEVIGTSPALQMVLARAAKVAPTDSTVLIMGETGTGKELIARAIHKRSKRSARPFISVNCAAVPSSLIMSEF